MKNLKNAILLTGAAARISQEVALIDQLIQKEGLEIHEESTYLAGYSSGALNVLAVNACFRKENPISWDQFYKNEILESLRNEDIYIKTHPIYWDTLPLRRTIKMFLKKAGLKKLGDLPFQSGILAFNLDKMKTYWPNNLESKFMNIELCDLLMASTAIPVHFPSQRINGIGGLSTGLPDGIYSDGGTGGTFKRFKRHFKDIVNTNTKFDTLHIISPMRDNNEIEYNKLNRLKFDHNTDNQLINDFFGHMSMQGFLKFLKKLHKANKKYKLANNIYVSMPNMENNTAILDFSCQMDKYDAVKSWCESNPEDLAINLDRFLERFDTFA